MDNIPWCELTSAEKTYVSSHERLEITFAEQLHQPILTFIGRRGRGRFLSWNEYKLIRKDDSSSSKKESKKGTEELDPDKISNKKKKPIGEWLSLVDEPTDSEEEKGSVSGPHVLDNEETESESNKSSDFQKAMRAFRKRQADPSGEGRKTSREEVQEG